MYPKFVAIAAVTALLAAGIGGLCFYTDQKNYSVDAGEHDGGKLGVTGTLSQNMSADTVTDAVGRTVEIPENLDRGIVTIGSSGPLRFLSCFDVYDKIIEVDKGDVTDPKNGRAYSYAYDFTKFSESQYHADNVLDAVTAIRIGNKDPSLIVIQQTVWNGYKTVCETLANRFTTVVISDQSMTEMWSPDYMIAPWMENTFRMLGSVLKQEDRAEEIIEGINGIISDIRSLVGSSDGKTYYVAGVTINGTNTLNTTFPLYLPLMLTDGLNAYDKGSSEPKVTIRADEVANIGFDAMIIDPSSSDKLSVKDSQDVLNYIHRINKGDNGISMYVTVPIVWDNINYDCVLVSSYYLLHVLYGTLTIDEVICKANAVFELFYGPNGSGVLDAMDTFFEKKSADNGVELPLFHETKVIKYYGNYKVAEISSPLTDADSDRYPWVAIGAMAAVLTVILVSFMFLRYRKRE